MDGSCYETYMTLCEPFRFADQWACISADPCAYRGPSDPNAALAVLVDRFSEQELLEAGIAQREVEGQVTMHPLLAGPEVALVALRDPATEGITNLMTSQGCVAGQHWPLFAVLRDRHTVTALAGSSGALLLTGNLEDAILLRSLGLAAAPIAGVTRLDHHEVTLLGKIFGVPCSPSPHEEAAGWEDPDSDGPASPSPHGASRAGSMGATPYARPSVESAPQLPGAPHLSFDGQSANTQVENRIQLTVVRWSPLSLSVVEPDTVSQAVQYLDELHVFRGLDLLEVNEWTAHSDDIAPIKFALNRNEATWVKDAVLDSLLSATDILNLSHGVSMTVAPPNDLATAIEHLQEIQFDSSNGDQSRRGRTKALAAYSQMVTKHVTGPMRRQAQAAGDPIERARQLVFADLIEVFMQKMPTVREQLLRGERPGSATELSEGNSVAELLAISKQVITLAKEMTSSTRNPKMQHRAGLVIDSPRFGSLASPTRS